VDRLRNLGFLLKDVSRLYTKRFEERATEIGVTLPQCKALAFLARNEGINQVRLAELTDIDPMSLVRILDRMEADGWIERRSDPNDRRARLLFSKNKSKPILERIWRVGDETRAEALGKLSAQQRNALIDLLETLHANLSELEPIPQSTARKPARSTS
jgi:MarR family transcriptional regulator, transcriptional regulator for hemolysin